MESRTAIVFGGTGLVGRLVIGELNDSEIYQNIIVFGRSASKYPPGSKIKEFIIDFSKPESFSDLIKGDDLYICMGTTIKKAGSVQNMEAIDRDLPVMLAKTARRNNVQRMVIVSSIGANPASSNYYLRIKGEMEQQILNIDFKTVVIVRPSLLLGDRKEKRFGESAGKSFMKLFGVFLFGTFKKYRAIDGKSVAYAMVQILNGTNGKGIYESDKLQNIADKK
jgi:uncharacterized protein YbjT (DUF2867 family)